MRRLAAKKPVVAVVGTVAASGAYIAALGADRIFVRGNSIVGSIGVLVEFPNLSGLLDKVGVKFEIDQVVAAEGRAQRPRADQRGRARCDGVADRRFLRMVQRPREGRVAQMSDDELAQVDDGRVFTGRQGLPLKLVDAIGGEREAIAWLEARKASPRTCRFATGSPRAGCGVSASPAWRRRWPMLFNLPELAQALRASDSLERDVALDGLVSIWKVRHGE